MFLILYSSTHNGDVVIMENAPEYYPTIEIRIKECKGIVRWKNTLIKNFLSQHLSFLLTRVNLLNKLYNHFPSRLFSCISRSTLDYISFLFSNCQNFAYSLLRFVCPTRFLLSACVSGDSYGTFRDGRFGQLSLKHKWTIVWISRNKIMDFLF